MKKLQKFISINFKKLTSLIVLTTILFFFFQPRSFESSISLYPSYQGESSLGSNLLSIASDFGIGKQMNNNAVIYTPDIVNSFLLKKAILLQSYASINNMTLIDYLINNEWIQIGEVDYDQKLQSYAVGLEDVIYLDVDRVSGLITIKTYFHSKELSEEVCNYIYLYLKDFINQSSISTTQARMQYYEKRLDELSSDLKTAENNLQNFLIDNKDISSPILQTEYLRYVRNVELQNQVYSLLRQQIESEKIQLKKDELNFVISDKYTNPIQVKISWKMLLLFNFSLILLLYVYSFQFDRLVGFFGNEKSNNY